MLCGAATNCLNLGRVGGPGEPHFTMGAEEAIQLCELIGFEIVVPLHYEDWTHFSEDRQQAARFFESRELGKKVHWLNRGVATTID